MRDTDYAYSVARIRANERYLLKDKDLSELMECKSFDSAISYLMDKKWIAQKGEISDCVRYQSEKLWQLLSECVPDKKELVVLCIVNDFFNIKASQIHDFLVSFSITHGGLQMSYKFERIFKNQPKYYIISEITIS